MFLPDIGTRDFIINHHILTDLQKIIYQTGFYHFLKQSLSCINEASCISKYNLIYSTSK